MLSGRSLACGLSQVGPSSCRSFQATPRPSSYRPLRLGLSQVAAPYSGNSVSASSRRSGHGAFGQFCSSRLIHAVCNNGSGRGEPMLWWLTCSPSCRDDHRGSSHGRMPFYSCSETAERCSQHPRTLRLPCISDNSGKNRRELVSAGNVDRQLDLYATRECLRSGEQK